MTDISQIFLKNHLLASLRPDVLDVLGTLEEVQLPIGSVLSEANAAIEHVHFICDGIASSGRSPMMIVGREGLCGEDLLVAPSGIRSPLVMQIAGSSLRMSASAFISAVEQSEVLNLVLRDHIRTRASERAQISAAAARHSLLPRTASWLLMCHDRIDGDLMPLNRSFLQSLVMAAPEALNDALQLLQANQCIRSTEGWIEIVNRHRLEGRAAGAYQPSAAPIAAGADHGPPIRRFV